MGILRHLTLAAAMVLFAWPAGAQDANTPAQPTPPMDWSGEVDRIFAPFADPAGPGCAVSAVRNGQLLVERSYGSANLEHGIPITSGTVFEAGSVSKQFTAAAILMLAQEGRLKLGDDIRAYLPEMPDYGRPITIEHLLTHTSGLRDWGDLAAFSGWPRTTRAYTQADILDIIVRQRALNYLPGTEYSYTNSGYNLLTEIVRRTSGQSLADFTRARIFQPLGMTATAWRDDFHRIVRGRATAYQRSGGGYQELMPFEDGYGNGGLLTTVGDLQAWNQALASGRLGDFLTTGLEQRGILTGGTRIAYGRGLMIQAWQGVEEVAHGGATAGYRAWLARYPAENLSIAVLCNASDAGALPLGRAVAALFLPPPIATLSPEPLREPAGYAGMYVNEKTGRPLVLVTVPDGSGLAVSGAGPLLPMTGDSVLLGGDVIAFQGRNAFVIRTLEGDRYLHRRTPGWAPSAQQLMGFAGRYRSDELNVTYRVDLKDGRLFLTLEDRPGATIAMGPMYQDAFNLSGNFARFVRDKRGKVTALTLASGRVRALSLRKIG